MTLADRLSKFPSNKENTPIKLHQNIQHINFTTDRINIIRDSLERDPILSTHYLLTMNGWPDRISQVPRIARQFWGARDELSIEEGLLIKENHICIPQSSMTGHYTSYTKHIWE